MVATHKIWLVALLVNMYMKLQNFSTGPCSTVGNVSGNRCESYCRSRGREFDPGLIPYFRGD